MELLLDERLVEELPEVRKFDDELLDDRLVELLPDERKFDVELEERLDDELDTVLLLEEEDELLTLPLLVALLTVLRPEVVALRKPELDVPPFTRLWFIPDDVAPLFLIVELTLLPFILLP